ncbi:sulfurtransferase [Arthrobacter sp.]|uniref:sulfurtransferase n=1 Tax=Arthrobacter sp. TaxID=1667 RepID=UPI003A92EC66
MDVLITAGQLADRLASGRRTVVLDVRWKLGSDTGHGDYLAGHVPCAVYVDLETELAAPPSAGQGRHPLPDPAVFAAAVLRWGIHPGDTVVAYDAVGGLSAARAWWLLRDAGLDTVLLLDGGWAAWQEAGGGIETGEVRADPGTWVPVPGSLPVIDADQAAAFAEQGILLDARAGERYRGEVEPVDPRPGHIPGALGASTAENLDAAGRFLPAESLRARFAGIDPALASGADGRPVAVYCGSGVSAAHQIAALEMAGVRAALYPGSYSQFSSDPDREVTTGPDA